MENINKLSTDTLQTIYRVDQDTCKKCRMLQDMFQLLIFALGEYYSTHAKQCCEIEEQLKKRESK